MTRRVVRQNRKVSSLRQTLSVQKATVLSCNLFLVPQPRTFEAPLDSRPRLHWFSRLPSFLFSLSLPLIRPVQRIQ